jgi:uncharacterized protein
MTCHPALRSSPESIQSKQTTETMSNDIAPKPSERTTRIHLLPLGAAVAIGLAAVLSTFIAAGTWKEVRKSPDKNNIRITGSARKRIVSDLIQWSATIEARDPERTAAYLSLKSGTDQAVAFLKEAGLKDDEIQTQSAFIIEEFETQQEDKVLPGTSVALRSEKHVSKGFRATQVVSVSSTNVALTEKASREITTLLERGIAVTSRAPEYYYTKLGEAKLEMLAEAAKDARSRAENILDSAGKTTLGKLVHAQMGIININPANSTDTSSQGNNDTTSRDKDIITIVHAEFKVN